jgi:cytochrome P450
VSVSTVQDRSLVKPIPAISYSQADATAAYAEDRLGFLLATARQYGPVVQLWPGLILVTGTAEVATVLSRTDRDFFHSRNFLFNKVDNRLGSAFQTNWMKARRAALAAMTADLVAEHIPWLAEMAAALTADWLRRGIIRDVTPELERLTSASIARFSFGSRQAVGVPAAAQEMLDALFPIFASPYEFPSYMRALQPREWKVRRRLRALHAALRLALASDGDGGMADVLAAHGLAEADAIRLLTSVQLAALGVPASALSWALVELACHPAEQERAAAAAARWPGSGPVPDEIGRVVDETLRLWPPSWLSGRMTEGSVQCGQWLMPARSRLLLPIWVIHRTAECYPEPESFDSRRWEALSPPPGAYVPYGAGPHRCLGARLAHAELTTVLAVLLSQARITLHGQARPDARRTLTPVGFELEVRRR